MEFFEAQTTIKAAPDLVWSVLVDGAGDLRARLLGHGVVVRDCTSFGLAGTVRIAVPRAEQFPALEKALSRSFEQAGSPR